MAGQAKLEESNIALLGSDLEKEVRKHAAETEEAYKGAGESVGIEIWRVEQFKVVKWKKRHYGTFFSGDSFIILHTYKHDATDKLLWDIHFWLGSKTSQDEAGVAAYMTVVLDDLLNTTPVQFREVQGYESEEFLSLWGDSGMRVLSGGVASGFHNISKDEMKNYSPRLMQVKGTAKRVVVREVECSASAMNHGDVFLLDCGESKLYQWNGEESGPFERRKASEVIEAIKTEREGTPDVEVLDESSDNEAFWSHVSGSLGDVKDAASGGADSEVKEEAPTVKVFRVSDSSGELKMEEYKSGDDVKGCKLDSTDVFIVDSGDTVFVWVGTEASKSERRMGMKYATDYLSKFGRPSHTPVVRVIEGSETAAFKKILGLSASADVGGGSGGCCIIQ